MLLKMTVSLSGTICTQSCVCLNWIPRKGETKLLFDLRKLLKVLVDKQTPDTFYCSVKYLSSCLRVPARTWHVVAQDPAGDDGAAAREQPLQVGLRHVLGEARHVQVGALDGLAARPGERNLWRNSCCIKMFKPFRYKSSQRLIPNIGSEWESPGWMDLLLWDEWSLK